MIKMFNKIAQGRVMNTEFFAFKKNNIEFLFSLNKDQITSTNVDTHLQTVVLEYCIKF